MRGLSSHGCKGMLLKVEGRCLAMRSLALAEDGVNVHMGKKPLRYLCSCISSLHYLCIIFCFIERYSR